MESGSSSSSSVVVSGIADLPDELLLSVFSCLTKSQLVTTIPRVCQHWHQLHTDPSLYRQLVFVKDEPITSVAVKLLAMSPWLKSLQMMHRADADEIVSHVGSPTPLLETLVVRNCRGTPHVWNLSAKHLRDVIRHCTKLTHLSFKHSKCGSREFYKDIGLRLPLLRVIDFGYASECISTDALLNVSNNCHHVEQVLGFHYNDISVRVIHLFFGSLRNTLKVIDINYALWTDATMELIGTIPNLEALYLNNAERVTDEGLMALSHVPHLAELHVSMADQVTSRGWVRFFVEADTSRIRLLSLTHCVHVDDDVMLTIGDMPHLEDLTVSFADRVTARGWTVLVRAPRMAGINRLSLRFSAAVDDRVARTIALNLRQLTRLDLLMCTRVTPEGHEFVRTEIPSKCHYHF